MGGDEPPCQPAGLLRAIEEETGYPCPRREAENADDGVCMELLALLSSPRLNPLFRWFAEVLLENMDGELRLRVLRRVAAAFSDERTAKLLPQSSGLF